MSEFVTNMFQYDVMVGIIRNEVIFDMYFCSLGLNRHLSECKGAGPQPPERMPEDVPDSLPEGNIK